jgi:prepilin-type N-terminal cleavage/methylation domain-containing protein
MKKGFTLIELMVVVVIIGILAAIAIPNFISMQRRAKEASVKNNMHTLQLAAEDFSTLSEGVYAADCGQDVNGATGGIVNLPQSISGGLVAGLQPQIPNNLLPATFRNPVVAANNSFDSPQAAFAQPTSNWAWNAANAGGVGYTAYDATIPVPNAVAPGTSPSTAVLYQVVGQGVSNALALVLSAGQ